MRVLGAILAGGRSTRFGSDKALAEIHGARLIDHAIDALKDHSDEVAVVGRAWPGVSQIADLPVAGLGPLGGLNGALHVASTKGFDAVLCASLDTFPLRPAVNRLRGHHCAVLARHWSVGIWPAHLAENLDRHIADGHLAMRTWVKAAKAELIDDKDLTLYNLNTTEALADAQGR